MWPLVSVIVGSLMTVLVVGKALNRTRFEDETNSLTDLWSQVKRDVNQSDLIVPTLCNAPCDRLFHAGRHGNISDCLCRCPEEMPIFLQTLGQCIQRIEACPRTIKFNDAHIPVVELPAKSHKLSFNHKVLWKESGVKVKTNTGARCNITSVEYLGRDQSWIELNANILYLGWEKEPIFKWNGSLGDNLLSEGTIILVNMDCSGNLKDSHCLTFRVNGALYYGDPFGKEQSSDRGAAFVAITLLVILLIMTLSCSVFIWNVCWKMKKNELITGLQLQFLYRLKQEKDMAEAAQHYQALAHAALNMEKQHDEYNKHLADKSQITPKRKLFFSPEFFDEEHMKTPPPMADQFLLDLRKMIKIARQRIQQQRHIPSLRTIPEEPPEFFEPYMKVKSAPTQIEKPPDIKPAIQETSPKSIDSVHSSTDSSDSAKENKLPEGEKRSPSIRRNESQSRIPINKYKTKSPKLNPKFIIPSTNSSIDLPPPLPPRNPPPPIPAKYRLKEDIAKMRKDKKSYAIFPSELEFKKSLPRRSRKLDKRVISNEL